MKTYSNICSFVKDCTTFEGTYRFGKITDPEDFFIGAICTTEIVGHPGNYLKNTKIMGSFVTINDITYLLSYYSELDKVTSKNISDNGPGHLILIPV